MPTGRAGIDPVYLRDLVESGGADLVHEVLETFLETVPPRFAALCEAVERADLAAVGAAAHAIVSPAAMVGLTDLQRAARAIEVRAAGGAPVSPAELTALERALGAATGLLHDTVRELLALPAEGRPGDG